MRYYQRAARYDPTATRVLVRVVNVAQRLDRYDVAARYAVLLSERDPKDEMSLLRALIYLSSTEQDERALALYEAAIAAGGEQENEIWFELHKIAGGVYQRHERPASAAKVLAKVRRALAEPETFGLDKDTGGVNEETAQALYLIMSQVFLEAGQADDAMAALTLAEKHGTDDAFVVYTEARILLKQEKFEAALEKLDAYFESNSQEAGQDVYRQLFRVLKAQGEEDQQISRLEELFAEHADNTSLGTFLAKQYSLAGRKEDSKRLYLKLMEDQPTVEGYRALAAIYREAGDVDQLLQLLGDLAMQTNSLALLGDELAAILKSDPTRTALFAAARQLDGEPIKRTFGPYLAMGMLAVDAKQLDVAGEFYERIITSEHAARPSVLLAWGLDLLMAKQYAKANDVLQRGLDEKLFPGSTSVIYYYLSGALVMLDRFDEAIAAARKAVAENSDSPDSLSRLAWVLARAGQSEEAQGIYETLIAKYESDFDSVEHRIVVRDSRLSLAQLHSQKEDVAPGAELLEQILDEYPEHVGAKNDLAYLWAEQDINLVLAETFSRDALAKEPDNAAYRDTLGWILFRLEKYDTAIAELRRAAELLEEPDAVVLDHLGDALEKAGRKDEAVRRWKEAVAAFDGSREADKKKQVQNKISEYTSKN